jgi:CBS-domain-containing membrane protein
VGPNDGLEKAFRVMEDNQVRRIPVVDDTGALVGIVTQAHVAKHASISDAGQLLQNLSRKSESPSRVVAHP